MSLVEGRFRGRPNRFLAEVDLAGRVVPCHLPNPGRLKELLRPGAKVYLRPQAGSRKTDFDMVAVDSQGVVVSLDTRLPNAVVLDLLSKGRLKEFQGYSTVLSEVRLGGSRLDFLLRNGEDCYLEVKSCTLVVKGVALFPDAPTVRGRRHLEELVGAVVSGYRAAVLFVVQRPDASLFGPNEAADPLFTRALRSAHAAGVEVYAYRCRFDGKSLVGFMGIQTSLGPG